MKPVLLSVVNKNCRQFSKNYIGVFSSVFAFLLAYNASGQTAFTPLVYSITTFSKYLTASFDDSGTEIFILKNYCPTSTKNPENEK